MKVLSYNIHKGFSSFNKKFVLKRIREILQTVDADIVFLQEVIGQHEAKAIKVEDWPQESQFEYLADKLWPHFAYGKNAVYTEGHHGNAILSKHTFLSWENINVSTNRFEQRGLLHGIIDYPGFTEPVHVICIHLDLLERGRQIQINRICDRIAAHVPMTAPLIVAGDSNDWRQKGGKSLEEKLLLSEVHKKLHGEHAKSFPSWKPFLKLDRVYFRGLTPIKSVCLTGSPWNELSDHVPIYAELEADPIHSQGKLKSG